MRYKCDHCGQPTNNIYKFNIGEKYYVHHTCDTCSEKMDKVRVWQNEQFQTNTMVCPWCETEYDYYDNIFEEGNGTCTCPYCDKEFEYECEHTITWTTRKPEELYEEEEQD